MSFSARDIISCHVSCQKLGGSPEHCSECCQINENSSCSSITLSDKSSTAGTTSPITLPHITPVPTATKTSSPLTLPHNTPNPTATKTTSSTFTSTRVSGTFPSISQDPSISVSQSHSDTAPQSTTDNPLSSNNFSNTTISSLPSNPGSSTSSIAQSSQSIGPISVSRGDHLPSGHHKAKIAGIVVGSIAITIILGIYGIYVRRRSRRHRRDNDNLAAYPFPYRTQLTPSSSMGGKSKQQNEPNTNPPVRNRESRLGAVTFGDAIIETSRQGNTVTNTGAPIIAGDDIQTRARSVTAPDVFRNHEFERQLVDLLMGLIHNTGRRPPEDSDVRPPSYQQF